MIRVKPSIVEMNFVSDSDNGNNVDSRCIRSDCIKKGSSYKQKWIWKKKEFIKLHIDGDTKSKKVS